MKVSTLRSNLVFLADPPVQLFGRTSIVGVGRLRDVLDHRRLTQKVETSRVAYYARRAWRRKKRVAVALLIVGLALGLGWALRPPLDLSPASAQFRGSTLTVENASGRVLEELEVGRSLVRNVKDGQAQRPVAFADVTGGQNKELFWGASPGEDARMDVLRAKAVGADTLLCERPLCFEVNFPGKPEVTGPAFGIAGLTAGDLNRDGRPGLYILANHRPYFPSLLLGLDPTDGHVNRRYVHPGHLRSGIETADLAGGPAPELLVGGHSTPLGAR